MEIYDPVAQQYAQAFPSVELRLFEWPWLKKQFSNSQGGTALDLGCGHGYLLTELPRWFDQVFGVEPSPGMRQQAQIRLAAHSKEKQNKKVIKLLEGSGSSIPLKDQSIDLAVSLLSFRYMDWKIALKQIHRVLKPQGTFLLVDLFAQDNALWHAPAIVWDGLRVFFGNLGKKEFQKNLNTLSQTVAWKSMVQNNPKRKEKELLPLFPQYFTTIDRKVLGQSLRGKIIAYRLIKATP